jgi:DNA polymerase III alpha subunit
MPRKQMIAELNVWEQLTVKERQHIKNNLITDLNGAKTKKEGGICHTEDRVFIVKSLIKSLTNSAYSTKDDPIVISRFETEFLGINLTCAKSDYINKNMASCNLEDVRKGTKNGTVIVELKDVRIFKAKTGKTKGRFMAHLILEDETGELPGVVFADQYDIYESLLIRGNMVMAKVFSKDFKSVFVNELWQA